MAVLAGAGIPGARWVPPENYHVTLRFIGEAPRYLAEEIDHALAALKAPAFALTLAGIGTFAKGGRGRRYGSGWSAMPALDRLQNKDRDGAATVWFGAGAAAVSAASDSGAAGQRGGGKIGWIVQAHNLFRAESVTVEHFTLFSSLLGKEQPVYTAEVEYALDVSTSSDLSAPRGGERISG